MTARQDPLQRKKPVRPEYFGKFRLRIILLFLACMLSLTAVNLGLNGIIGYKARFEELRTRLLMTARTAALSVDAKLVRQVPLSVSGTNHPAYRSLAGLLNRIRSENPEIYYIYLLTSTDKPHMLKFVVDPDCNELQPGEDTSRPGDPYDASEFPEMIRGFEKASADRELARDEWGVMISGYAPIRAADGTTVAIIGIDLDAKHVADLRRNVLVLTLLLLLLSLAIAGILSLLIGRWIERPVLRMVEGTRRVGQGDLAYRISEAGDDEMGELARSFNRMTEHLEVSKKNIAENFYRVVKSLTRILEARDPYTFGHSERVTFYAVWTAREMGLTPERIQTLEEATRLHDIGKVGVPDGVLNKKEKLTNEEWGVIQQHPLIGEEILKPFLDHSELLEIVRGHHEREDGKGYPDRKHSGDIDLLMAIVAVADAFDAMTSSRAYRPAMSDEAAIAELEKNSGTQFRTDVVRTFVNLVHSGVFRSTHKKKPEENQSFRG
jgi:HD-GYP domain-containing protein (c-di-GMP phosphodiesterase class II)